MPPRAILIIVTILGALVILGAAWGARSGRLTGRTSKMLMVSVIALAAIVVWLYPWLALQDTVGD